MKTQNLLEELKKAGVRAREYVKPPFGESVFGITIKPDHPKGTVLVYQGNAKVEAHPDKSCRQCAVTIREGNRVIKRHVKDRISTVSSEPSQVGIERKLCSSFPVIMPSQTVWTFENIKTKKEQKTYSDDDQYWLIEADVIATVKNRTINHFLIGMDETRNFICPLPGKPESVLHAREMLRPDEAKKPGTKRQGEWFFVPVSKEVARKLRKPAYRMRLGNTQHTARKAIVFAGDIYAHGYVIDERVGHHKPTFLKGWHKVVKNKESTLRVSEVQKDAAKRRTRAWD